jgi:hypothetical protein
LSGWPGEAAKGPLAVKKTRGSRIILGEGDAEKPHSLSLNALYAACCVEGHRA